MANMEHREANIVSLEAHKAAEGRNYWKDMHLKKSVVTPGDVICAAINIYQDELGYWFEDEGLEGLWNDAAEAYERRHKVAANRDVLIDMIVADLGGETIGSA